MSKALKNDNKAKIETTDPAGKVQAKATPKKTVAKEESVSKEVSNATVLFAVYELRKLLDIHSNVHREKLDALMDKVLSIEQRLIDQRRETPREPEPTPDEPELTEEQKEALTALNQVLTDIADVLVPDSVITTGKVMKNKMIRGDQ